MGGNSKREYLAAILERYIQASRKEKGIILREFCAVCGYYHKHAIRLLNQRQKETAENAPAEDLSTSHRNC